MKEEPSSGVMISTFSLREFDFNDFLKPIHPINSTDVRFPLEGFSYSIFVLRNEWEEILRPLGQIFVIQSCDISDFEGGLFEEKGFKT